VLLTTKRLRGKKKSKGGKKLLDECSGWGIVIGGSFVQQEAVGGCGGGGGGCGSCTQK